MRIAADRAIDVRMVMEKMGLDEIEAAFVVALARGEIHGDVEPTGPMTPEDRRLMGLDVVAGEEGDPDLKRDPARVAEIVKVMREAGVDEVEAAFIVALARGETYGDVESVGPMTPEERRRIGLDVVAFDDDELVGDDDDLVLETVDVDPATEARSDLRPSR